jgi:nucleotide-binding universal stress UspA family protein
MSASSPASPRPHLVPGGLADLIVLQDRSTAARAAFELAAALASAHGATVSGAMFALKAEIPSGLYMESVPDVWFASERAAAEETARLEALLAPRFSAIPEGGLRKLGCLASDAGIRLAEEARTADLAVIGWPAAGADSFLRRVFETCLFQSGRPVLLVPEATPPALPEAALVGWNGTKEAARAVHDALPFFRRIRQVTVLSVDQPRVAAEEAWTASGIVRHLARHGIVAEAREAASGGRAVSEVIAEEAKAVGASLAVLGGYGHARLAEWVFGGVTRDTLAGLALPTLFSH